MLVQFKLLQFLVPILFDLVKLSLDDFESRYTCTYNLTSTVKNRSAMRTCVAYEQLSNF